MVQDLSDGQLEAGFLYDIQREELETLISELASQDPRADSEFWDLPISLEELQHQMPKVKAQVDELLGTSEVPTPRVREFSPLRNMADFKQVAFGYGLGGLGISLGLGTMVLDDINLYNVLAVIGGSFGVHLTEQHRNWATRTGAYYQKSTGDLILNKPAQTRTGGPLTLAHEYTHAVQDFRGFLTHHTRYLQEGLAITVESALADKEAESGNPNAKVITHSKDLWTLRNAYLKYCKYNRHDPRTELVGIGPTRIANWHDLGRAIFAVAEARHGRDHVLEKAMNLERFW